MNTILCRAKIRQPDLNTGPIIDAILTKPGLTWADQEYDYPIASFNLDDFPPESSIHLVFDADIFEIEVTHKTGKPLTEDHRIPAYIAKYLKNKSEICKLQIDDNHVCLISQIKDIDCPVKDLSIWETINDDSDFSYINYLNNTLGIQYKNESIYAYSGVGLDTYIAFFQSSDLTKYFINHIKGKYQTVMMLEPRQV